VLKNIKPDDEVKKKQTTPTNKGMSQPKRAISGIRTEATEGISDDSRGVVSNVLPPVQRMTLLFIRQYVAQHGFAPTLKDIAAHLEVRSASTAHFHLERLIEKGYLTRGEYGALWISEQDKSATSNYVPLLGTIAAGVPLEAIENPHTIEIPARLVANNGTVFCLEVSGDSMIDAHICDGDIVVVRQQDYADNGQIVVALLDDGSATLKTYRRLKTGHVMLIPANKELEAQKILQPLTLENVTIQGRVIGVIREL
jgi:repressor LexA